jgi:hypothetical protein
LHRYDTKPKRVINPPSVEHTMLKLVTDTVGMLDKPDIASARLGLSLA